MTQLENRKITCNLCRSVSDYSDFPDEQFRRAEKRNGLGLCILRPDFTCRHNEHAFQPVQSRKHNALKNAPHLRVVK